MNNRWFGGRPIYAELSPVTDFREACCRSNYFTFLVLDLKIQVLNNNHMDETDFLFCMREEIKKVRQVTRWVLFIRICPIHNGINECSFRSEMNEILMLITLYWSKKIKSVLLGIRHGPLRMKGLLKL